jgi:GrpB-like predicted nucleotidyltransferase (UPF0157 family)
MLAEVPMPSVADLIGRHPSDPAMTAASMPPIGPYRRAPVEVYQADPAAPEVARRLIALIATRWPGTPAEHVGSSAVAELPGKGIIDLLLPAEPADIPAVTQALLGLGFRYQLPAVFPASRPMLWGAFRHGPTDYRVHVHVVPASSPEVTAMRGFRDALRSDPILRCRYAALKRAIVAGGPVDSVAFSKAKHDWIAAALDQLGLTNGRQRRLYKDHPSLQRTGLLTPQRPLGRSRFTHAPASGTTAHHISPPGIPRLIHTDTGPRRTSGKAEAAHAAQRRQRPDHGS